VFHRSVSSIVLAASLSAMLAPATVVAQQIPPVPTVAPGYVAPPAVAPSPPAIVGIVQQPFVGIQLSDAIGMALLRNPDLAVASANRRIAEYQIVSAKGAYDVRFNLEPSVSYEKTAPTNPFLGGPNFGPLIESQQQVQAGVTGQLENGQQYNVSLSNGRIDSNSQFNSFNPTYQPTFSFDLTQPLLKNSGENPVRNQVTLAIIGSDATDAQTLASVSQTISTVSNTYWDLVAAWRLVAIQEEALHEAVLQLGSTQRLARQGAAAKIDAVQSQGQVAMFQDNVYSAFQAVATLQNQLKGLIAENPGDPIWQANLVPTSPVQNLPAAPTLNDLYATAIKQRPEVREAMDQQRQADENIRFAANQVKPQVDLKVGYTNNGFAGQPFTSPVFAGFGTLPPTPPYLIGTNGQAVTNLLQNKFPSYSAGVLFTTPIGNHTAKADLAIAHEQERIAGVQGSGTLQRIAFEARNALQSYQSALSRLAAARTSRETAEQVYASEVRKFKNGVSTTYFVLQRQVELAQARGRELQAQTDLNKAVVELERVSGNSLNANGVNLDTLGAGAAK
jgi:outer membrane protein